MATNTTDTSTTTAPPPVGTPPAPSAVPVFSPDQAGQLLDLLGLPADTTDPDLIVATVADLVAQVAAELKPSEVAAAAERQGFDLIDADSLAALRREAAEGRQVKAAAEAQRVEASVDDAIRKGKITPSRRKHWVDLIAADPGMADVLARTPDETATAMSAIGHGVDAAEGSATHADAWLY